MIIETRDGIARLALADGRSADALADALRSLDADPCARVLLVSGDWSAAGDAMRDAPDDDDPVAALAALRIPAAAWIDAPCCEEALELALAADVRIAGPSAAFRMAQTREGRMPRRGGTQRLPRAVGRGHAMRMLLAGETLDAAEAVRAGLACAAASEEDADGVVSAVACAAPIAAQYVKEAVAASADLPLRDGMRLEADLSILLHSTADRAEGVRSFLDGRGAGPGERRPPRFEGR